MTRERLLVQVARLAKTTPCFPIPVRAGHIVPRKHWQPQATASATRNQLRY